MSTANAYSNRSGRWSEEGPSQDALTSKDQQHWLTMADQLAALLAESAVERDRQGGHAAMERELMRESGLLTLAVPTEYGGQGQPWSFVYRVIRRLARVDSALAHVFAFHHLQVGSVILYGNRHQQQRLLTPTAHEHLFWGNALNPLDKRTTATECGDGGFILQGKKGFCSGAKGSDYLTLSAWHEPTQSLVIAAVPTRRPGITVHDDWDAIGQRQTDSGTVSFEQVAIRESEVLLPPGAALSPAAQFRTCLAQLVLVNLYVGIAEGAFEEAKRYTLEQGRPWLASEAAQAQEDPYLQRHFGELWVTLRSAQALADIAGDIAQHHFVKRTAISDEDRGATAVATAEAKVVAHQAALDASSRLFDIAGARATARPLGLDRFWRNARTHTLHDPVDYKIRDLGRWALLDQYPVPTSYS